MMYKYDDPMDMRHSIMRRSIVFFNFYFIFSFSPFGTQTAQ